MVISFQTIVSKNLLMQKIMMIWILSMADALTKRGPIFSANDVLFVVKMRWMTMSQKVSKL